MEEEKDVAPSKRVSPMSMEMKSMGKIESEVNARMKLSKITIFSTESEKLNKNQTFLFSNSIASTNFSEIERPLSSNSTFSRFNLSVSDETGTLGEYKIPSPDEYKLFPEREKCEIDNESSTNDIYHSSSTKYSYSVHKTEKEIDYLFKYENHQNNNRYIIEQNSPNYDIFYPDSSLSNCEESCEMYGASLKSRRTGKNHKKINVISKSKLKQTENQAICTCKNCRCETLYCLCRKLNRFCDEKCNCDRELCRNFNPKEKIELKQNMDVESSFSEESVEYSSSNAFSIITSIKFEPFVFPEN